LTNYYFLFSQPQLTLTWHRTTAKKEKEKKTPFYWDITKLSLKTMASVP
jgi:hypothetical protein